MAGVALLLAACGTGGISAPATTARRGAGATSAAPPVTARPAPTTAPHPAPTTTTRPAPPATTAPPTTAPPATPVPTTTTTRAPASGNVALPAPGPGFVAGHVTAVGDSVMLDYQDPLQQDIPGVTVEAAVSRQWSDGEALLQQLKAAGQLGAVVIVGLGTNGPITSSDFDTMMSVLGGASRVVFVNVVVDRPWQDGNDAVLAAGVASHPGTVLADWASLEAANPGWVYAGDGTHLPIDGPGAQALAALVASKA